MKKASEHAGRFFKAQLSALATVLKLVLGSGEEPGKAHDTWVEDRVTDIVVLRQSWT